MTAVAPSRPLFVFGTLCDADVRQIVLGDVPVVPRPAVLAGYRAVRLPSETYPVLSPEPTGQLGGLLLDLEDASLERVAFYEGDEYGFEDVTVQAPGGDRVAALVCADRAARTDARIPWTLADWQLRHKDAFMPVVCRYMALFGQMSAADADRLWQSMTAAG